MPAVPLDAASAARRDDVPAFSAAWRHWAGGLPRRWEYDLPSTQGRWSPWLHETVAQRAPQCLAFVLQALRADKSRTAREAVLKALIKHQAADLVPAVASFFIEPNQREVGALQEALRQGADGVAVALLHAGWPARDVSDQSPFLLAVRMDATQMLEALKSRGEPERSTEAMVTLQPKEFQKMWGHLSPAVQAHLAPKRMAHNTDFPNRFASESALMASALSPGWMPGWGEAAIVRHRVKPLQWLARQVSTETLQGWLPRWQRAAIRAIEEGGAPQECVWWLDRAGVSWSASDVDVLFDDALKTIEEQGRHRIQPLQRQAIEEGLTQPASLEELNRRDQAPCAHTHGVVTHWRTMDGTVWKDGLHLGRLIRRFPEAFEARMLEQGPRWWVAVNQSVCVEALRPMAPFVMDWDMPLRVAQWHGGIYGKTAGFEVPERQARHRQWWRAVLAECPEEERRVLDRPHRAIVPNFIVLGARAAEVGALLDQGYRARGVDAWDERPEVRQEADQWWCQQQAEDEWLTPAGQALFQRLHADQPSNDAKRLAPMTRWKTEYPEAAARWDAMALAKALEPVGLDVPSVPARRRPRL